MKNLVLASVLSSVATALAVPALTGPVHYAITRPYSLFGQLPGNPNGQASSVVLGTAPLDFVMTDVLYGASGDRAFVTVNGNPVLNLGMDGQGHLLSAHMTTGIFIPAGSSIGVQIPVIGPLPIPVTVAGYVQ